MSDFQVILFVGQPAQTDLAVLLEDFQQDAMLTILHVPALGTESDSGVSLLPLLDKVWPDLICLFADDLERQGEDVLAFCLQLRERSAPYRPVLVVQSPAQEEKRIQYLIQGADDILGPDLSLEEFKVRLLVHLRRNLGFVANEITQLPSLSFTGKVAQRRLNQQKPLALLAVELNHLNVYTETYGDLPTYQVLRTVAALLSRLIMVPDFVSHTDENHFVIVSQPERAEKMAALLCRQFETVSPNFYSDKDRKQGYMISVIADQVSRRVPLMGLSIGIASTETQPLESFLSLFNVAQQMKALARMRPGSGWQSDRLRLAGSQTPCDAQKPGILVVETDAALAYLLNTTLHMEGYAVEMVNSLESARSVLAQPEAAQPLNLLILDAVLHEEEAGLLLASEVRQAYPEVSIICMSSLHNRQRVLQAGVDLYLPKPFELSTLFSWVHRLLSEGR